MSDKTDAEVLAFLCAGYKLRYKGDTNDCELVHHVGEISSEQIARLIRQDFLESFANSGGFNISDKGKAFYIRSTDELRKDKP